MWGLAAAYGLWRYRNVTAVKNGPIDKLHLIWRDEFQLWDAFAYLRPELRAANLGLHLYNDVDGTGTDADKSLASLKAVSEALERWAFYSLGALHQFGFPIERTTNGMAAHPGPSGRAAREAAYAEAIERWSLRELWEGRAAFAQKKLYSLDQGSLIKKVTPKLFLVVRFQKTACGYSYGFACGQEELSTQMRAQIEMQRNERVLSHRQSKIESDTHLGEQERRLLYFSSPQGFALFQERMLLPLESQQTLYPPRLLIDEELPGPWSSYTHVWRCVLDKPKENPYENGQNLFRF